MSSTAISSITSSGVSELAKSLLSGCDANSDGQVSTEEFASFLDSFVKSLVGSQNTTSGASTTTSAATATTLLNTTSAENTSSTTSASELPPCPAGWNPEKWADSSHTSIKYVAGRIMAGHSPSDWLDDTKRAGILEEFKAAGLNPTASGKDLCDFNDGYGPVDIVRGASIGGVSWRWGVQKQS